VQGDFHAREVFAIGQVGDEDLDVALGSGPQTLRERFEFLLPEATIRL